MKPKYSVFEIANYFLLKAKQDGQELLSNMKLQKLVYYAQGLHCALYNKPLFPEKLVAWTYGPIVPELYRKYKRYQARGIAPDKDFNPDIIDERTEGFLNNIYKFFGQFSAIRLMEMAHTDKCYIDACDNNEITIDSMKVYLRKYLKNDQTKKEKKQTARHS